MKTRALAVAALVSWCALAGAEKRDYQVSQNSDDAEENAGNGNMSLGSSDLELIADGGTNQLVGIRFQNIEIPQGTTIVSAFLEFETDETNAGATSVTIQGEDIDDAPTFTGDELEHFEPDADDGLGRVEFHSRVEHGQRAPHESGLSDDRAGDRRSRRLVRGQRHGLRDHRHRREKRRITQR